ncbi:MAG: hypothetical protein GF365_01445 [Candidatus Buchananbacteria bacterium]|nr:hypothetical protein [Candidatus Buchananbacteria bacterium]
MNQEHEQHKNTHLLFDGKKIIISPDIKPVFNFLGEIEKEKFKSEKFADAEPIITGRDFNRYTDFDKRYFDLNKVDIFGGTKNSNKHKASPKLLIRKTGDSICATLDKEGIFAEQSVYLAIPKEKLNVFFILGVLNSKLLNYYFRNKFIAHNDFRYLESGDLDIDTYKIIKSNLKEILLKMNGELSNDN